MMKWIDSTNLNHWADSRDAQALLPQLIRRLILAFHAPRSLTFPSGDAVWLPGYDGILETTDSSLYVPTGKSVWECGCDSNPKSKANKDYAKRSKEPLDMIPSKTKYIFITPRIFKNKEKWVEEKKAEGIWEDVYAYDARDLECWVEQAPAVGAWLAKQLGVFTADITAADDIKEDWSCISTPSINIKIVLAGRARETAALTLWLNKEPSSQTVQAPTKREAVLFLIAVASQMPQEQTDEFFSRCVIASSPDAFRQLVLSKHPLILIPSFETDGSMFLRAAQAGHHVFIPLDPTNTANGSQLILSRLDRDGFVSCLKESGLSDEGADELNRETGRSLKVCDIQIGHVLSKTPQNKKAITWPPEYVCQLIDTIESEDITHGFEVQVYNNRGATTRSMSEGGRQERDLVEKYKSWSRQLATKYPRTAACLNSIADTYERDAKRQDQSSEWNSLEF